MNKIKTFIIIILSILVAIFAVQNSAIVEIQFLFWGFSSPRVFIFLTLLIIGFLLGLLASNVSVKKRSDKHLADEKP
jgi:putative membrane protein